MKIILSRKGFDSSNGSYPSPILPDGTMLSMPIPGDDGITYSEIQHNGITYSEILSQLTNNQFREKVCHLDPDIRPDLRSVPVENWSPAFGQASSSQGLLQNAGVEVGDIFLFFGWFKKTKKTDSGYKYMTKRDSDDFYDVSDLHAIYGYMQIGEIIKDKAEIQKYVWHPHSQPYYNEPNFNNALYIPAEKLSFAPDVAGSEDGAAIGGGQDADSFGGEIIINGGSISASEWHDNDEYLIGNGSGNSVGETDYNFVEINGGAIDLTNSSGIYPEPKDKKGNALEKKQITVHESLIGKEITVEFSDGSKITVTPTDEEFSFYAPKDATVTNAEDLATGYCDHMCHQGGIMAFFWKIVNFFSKLFGSNPVCKCGAAHY